MTVRLVNSEGRAALEVDEGLLDVNRASHGRFGPDPLQILGEWKEFESWAGALSTYPADRPRARLGPPIPNPRQIFAVGLNYVDHAHESGFQSPADPVIFTKFASSLCGPEEVVVLPGGNVDWEVEMVLVIGERSSNLKEASAWSHVAGVMVGQDLSERTSQFRGETPQFSLAKSFEGFGPVGPAMVTLDELADRDDLTLGCRLNGVDVQKASTKDMIFPVPELLARLSRVVTLLPGDLIFTGTPPGVGYGRSPQVFLQPGDNLESYVDGVGTLRQRFVSPDRLPGETTPAIRVSA